MGQQRQDKAACGDIAIDMGQDESLLLLIKHCRDMKRQETRLRMATLFLFLSCTAVFILCTFAEIRRSQSCAPGGQEGVPAYSRQEHFIDTDTPQVDFTGIHLDLTGLTMLNGHHMKWDPSFGEEYYNETEGAIVIPQKGKYYVYMRIGLLWMCKEETETEASECTENKTFNIQLHEWKDSYPKDVVIMEAWDDVPASANGMRNVYLGRIFDLTEGSRLKVRIGMGNELIDTTQTSFGCFLL